MAEQSTSSPRVIQADLVWFDGAFRSDVQVMIGDDGRIAHVGALDAKPDVHLSDCSLLPGFVNAHSHAFQRGLRGLGESFPSGSGSFWKWREAMYALVEEMDEARMYDLCLAAFGEMLDCGMTTVGEFHYLHHDSGGGGYKLDDVVSRAARDAGIRMVLLSAFYNTGGIGKSLESAQRRFVSDSLDAYWSQFDALAERLDGETQSLGVVAHSIRAASVDDVAALHAEASRRGLVFHMHIEEQRREIEECNAAYGKPPTRAIMDALAVDSEFTSVHCTHTEAEDMRAFASAGGNVCICPLTEGNLGDGIADVPVMLEAGANLCVGSDSNARISMTEELRMLEYVQRLARERRGVFRGDDGDCGTHLLNIATAGGARSLGIEAGAIKPGALADMLVVDLSVPSLAGWDAASLLSGFLLGAADHAVAGTFVGGRFRRCRGALRDVVR